MRRQLLVSLLSTLALVGVVAALGIYFTVEVEFSELFDYELRQVALSFRDDSLGHPVPPPIVDQQDDLVIQIWDRDGNLAYISDPIPVPLPRVAAGYSSVQFQGAQWRIYSVQLRDHTIQVAQPKNVRHALAASAASRTLLPILFLVASLSLVIWFIIDRGLRPLDRVAAAVGQRSESALHPLADDDLPAEVRPLVSALNRLLDRLAGALALRQTFIADAAHELRTPLTAVQLQIQIARRASNDKDRTEAFAQLDEGVKRAIHLVEQLLTLAREEPESASRAPVPVELSQLARQAVADHVSIAEAKDVDLGLEVDPASGTSQPVWVSGDFEALRAMLGNLIDNAIRYIQRGGRVDVSVRRQDGEAVLTVVDNGPGIPATFRERAFDRFSRLEGTGEVGSGLGLAIVKNVVDRHHATVSLDSAEPDHGLRVMVRFPALNP